LRNFANSVDLFICKSTFLKNQIRKVDSHLFTYDAAGIVKYADVRYLLLTHFWPDIDKQEYVDEEKSFLQCLLCNCRQKVGFKER
jgi:ribonuclease BN (tRNA processing enzyme)